MTSSNATLAWGAVAVVLAVFSVPWFLWGDDAVVAGLPLWLWWHVGWMALSSLVFYVFTRRGWGAGVVAGERERTDEEVAGRG